MSRDEYLGYVILQSLADKSWLDRVRIEARRQIGGWTFLLVPVEPEGLDAHLIDLQAALKPNEPWYADYARGEELLIVFKGAVFAVGGDRAQWTLAVAYGFKHGVPREQLDFKQRTADESRKFFGLPAPS
jgi:hypothetical protein